MKRPMVEGDHWRLDVILERKAVSLYGREKGGTQRGGAHLKGGTQRGGAHLKGGTQRGEGTLEVWKTKGWGHI